MNETDDENIEKKMRPMLHCDMEGLFPVKTLICSTPDKIF